MTKTFLILLDCKFLKQDGKLGILESKAVLAALRRVWERVQAIGISGSVSWARSDLLGRDFSAFPRLVDAVLDPREGNVAEHSFNSLARAMPARDSTLVVAHPGSDALPLRPSSGTQALFRDFPARSVSLLFASAAGGSIPLTSGGPHLAEALLCALYAPFFRPVEVSLGPGAPALRCEAGPEALDRARRAALDAALPAPGAALRACGIAREGEIPLRAVLQPPLRLRAAHEAAMAMREMRENEARYVELARALAERGAVVVLKEERDGRRKREERAYALLGVPPDAGAAPTLALVELARGEQRVPREPERQCPPEPAGGCQGMLIRAVMAELNEYQFF